VTVGGDLIAVVRSRVSLKLTLTLVGFVAIAIALAGLYLSAALQSFAERSLESRLHTAARLLHDEARMLVASAATPDALQAFAWRAARPTESRVTLIARDGRVFADSGVASADVPRLDNHADRPEVRTALAGTIGRDVRTSATVDEPLFYVGVPVTDGGRVVAVLRLALPLSVVSASHRAVGRVLAVGALVALVTAAAIGVFVSRRITRPVVEMERIARRMSEGDFRARAPVRSTDEIGSLARALNLLAGRLRDKIEDLEHEHAKVTTVLDTMADGVIAVDAHDEVLLLNQPARAMFRVPEGRGERKPLLEIARNADLHAIVRLARGAGERSALLREISLGDPPRTLEVHAMPLRLGAGPLGVVMVLSDVTELRRLERVRTEFVANVSHELRTPLTAILGYVETVLGGAVDRPEDGRRFLEIVHHHTERLGRLLNELTELSNIELGRVRLEFAPTALGEVAESAAAILRGRAEAAGVRLDVDVPPALPAVRADPDRLQQIVINLVDNAVKYTPRGGTVTVRARETDDDSVELAVIDTGVGIPPADLPRVTERFYRVDKARSRELGGTGLGLAIVKHLVQAHGGELTIESLPDRGTTARVRLRRAADAPGRGS
jgi:two-component system phosphate regulon sensor histidine kinase PhoR